MIEGGGGAHIIIPRPRNELSLVSYTYGGREGGMGNVRERERGAKSNLPLQITFIGWDCQVPPESKR